MKNILSEMYYNIYGSDVTVKSSSRKIFNRAEKILCKKLKGKYKELFSDYEMAYSEYCAIVAEESFKKGFKSGIEFERELQKM